VLLEEDSGPTSAKTNLENILHKGESATHEMDAIFRKKTTKKQMLVKPSHTHETVSICNNTNSM